MEQPLPANHASSRQPGTTCENRDLRTKILSTIKSRPSTFLIFQAVQPSFRNMVLSAKPGFHRKPHYNGNLAKGTATATAGKSDCLKSGRSKGSFTF
jgi:hypothetical protein